MTSMQKSSGRGLRLTPVLLLASAMGIAVPTPSPATSTQNPVAMAADGTRLLASPPPLAQSDYSVGDKLKISFFAQLNLPNGADSTAVKTFYQRLDLTGNYAIDNDGTVDIPRLGRIVFAGRKSDEVKADLVSAYEEEIGQSGDVHVAVVERQPIYVVGPVRTPGQYKFAPGMVAIQAVALAGGMARPNDVVSTVVETEKASGSAAEARTRLATLMARKARLEAEQSGSLIAVPPELSSLVGSDRAEALVDAEHQARLKADHARTVNIRMYEELATQAEAELRGLEQDIRRVDGEIEARRRQLTQIVEPDPRLTNQKLETLLRTEIVSLEGRLDAYKREARQLSQRALQGRNAGDKLQLDHDAKVSQDLVTVNEEIAKTAQLAASGDMLSSSIDRQAGSRELESMAITIVRGTAEGPVMFPASPTTTLAPGDVVQLAGSNPLAQAARQLTESLGQ